MNTGINSALEWLITNPLVFLLLIIWTLGWKGLALWKSAGLRQKYWFIAILLLNTLGLLEIFYLFIVSRKYEVEVMETD